MVFDNKQGVAENLQSVPITEEDGRKFKKYIYRSHIENNCFFSLYLKFGVFKWKCDFISSFLRLFKGVHLFQILEYLPAEL